MEALDVAEAELLRSIALTHGALIKGLGRDLDQRLVDAPLLRFRVVAVAPDALRRALLELVLRPAVGHLQQLARAGPDVLPQLGSRRAALLRRARRRLRGVAAVLLGARGLAAQHGGWGRVCHDVCGWRLGEQMELCSVECIICKSDCTEVFGQRRRLISKRLLAFNAQSVSKTTRATV